MAFLTQEQVETRLKVLRDQREAIDREIADCLVFLDLGRRLQAGQVMPSVTTPPQPISPAADGPEAPETAGRGRGRAIVACCITILREAGRPMHASELLDRLHAAGFEVAGLDPVAALNTRLWKRSGAGGPFRRLGDAVYELSSKDDAPSIDGASDTQARKPRL